MYKSKSTPSLSTMTTAELTQGRRVGMLRSSVSTVNLRKRPKPNISVTIPKNTNVLLSDAPLQAILLTPLPQKTTSHELLSSPTTSNSINLNMNGGSTSLVPPTITTTTTTRPRPQISLEELNRQLLGDDYVAPEPKKPINSGNGGSHHVSTRSFESHNNTNSNGTTSSNGTSRPHRHVTFQLDKNDDDADELMMREDMWDNVPTTKKQKLSFTDHINNGVDYIIRNRTQEAIRSFTSAIETEPKNPSGYFNRGLVHLQCRNYDSALMDFTNAIFNGCNESVAFFSRGMCHLSNKNYARAVADFTRALALDPKDMESLVNRGMAHTQLGNYDAALSDYNSIIAMNPNSAVAFHHRSIVQLHRRQYAEALSDAEQAWMKEKGNLEYQTRLAKLTEAMEEGAIGIFMD